MASSGIPLGSISRRGTEALEGDAHLHPRERRVDGRLVPPHGDALGPGRARRERGQRDAEERDERHAEEAAVAARGSHRERSSDPSPAGRARDRSVHPTREPRAPHRPARAAVGLRPAPAAPPLPGFVRLRQELNRKWQTSASRIT